MDILRMLIDAANRHDTDAMTEFLGEDMVFENPSMPGPTGPEGIQQFHGALFAAFPDLVYNTERMLESGDMVLGQFLVEGTQEGEFSGIPATNKKVSLPVAFVVEFDEGKVQHWTSYFDQLSMMQQLGVAPEGP